MNKLTVRVSSRAYCKQYYSKRPRGAAALWNGGTSLALWTRVTSLHRSLSFCNWAYRWSVAGVVAGVVVWIYCSCHWQVRSYTDWPNTEHQHLWSVAFYYRVVVVVVIVVVYSLLCLCWSFVSLTLYNSSSVKKINIYIYIKNNLLISIVSAV